MSKANVPSEKPTLDDRRQAVYDALKERSPEAAGYYRSAIMVLLTPAETGEQRAKVSSVCHSFREIMNSLATILGESSSPLIVPSSGKLLKELPETRLDLEGDEPVVIVARDVATPLDEILRTVILENARVEDDLSSLFAGMKQEAHPLVKQWKKAHGFFQGWAHWDRPKDESRAVPSDEELEAQVRIVEDIIAARAAPFFDALNSIEDLLADANRTSDEAVS